MVQAIAFRAITLARTALLERKLWSDTRTPAWLRSTSRPPITFTDEPFLGDRSDQRAVAGKNEAAREAARAVGTRAILGIKKPFVSPERAVEPQGVVEARRLDRALEHRAAV